MDRQKAPEQSSGLSKFLFGDQTVASWYHLIAWWKVIKYIDTTATLKYNFEH